MNGKGDKPRFYPDEKYRNNYKKIFGDKMSNSRNNTTPEQYLSMWLSEQIPTDEWLSILKERTDVNNLYQKHLEKYNGKTS